MSGPRRIRLWFRRNVLRNPQVSVKDFGAKGDMVTDDKAAIQAAIDYQARLNNPRRKGRL